MSLPFSLSMKAVVRNIEGDLLIIRRSDYSKHNAGKWDFPGGKVDIGENFDVALIREIKEETGLDAALTRALGYAESRAPERVVIYLFMEAKTESGNIVISDEHTDYKWISPSSLPQEDLCHQFLEVSAELVEKL